MRIGELAREVGISADTIRFYERSGWLPSPGRRQNNYREYGRTDIEHLRLLIDLRRMDLSLELAAEMAGWCHSGHCTNTTTSLPSVIAVKRSELAGRMSRLRELDARLADLQTHLSRTEIELTVLASGGPCCSAAGAVTDVAEGGCSCCATGSLTD
jgi:DNA-binding transcriptional MerR regulator